MTGKLIARLRRYAGVDLCRVMARDLGAGTPAAEEGRGFEYRALTRAEVLQLCADPDYQLGATWVRRALARGHICFGALDDGRVAGYLWLAYTSARYANRIWIRTDTLSRYTYKVFVRPEHRGRGLVQELYRRSDEAALARGRTRAIMVVQVDNLASTRAAERNGFRTVGYAGYIAFGGGALALRSPGARRAAVRFYSVQPPRTMPAWRSTVAALVRVCLSLPLLGAMLVLHFLPRGQRPPTVATRV